MYLLRIALWILVDLIFLMPLKFLVCCIMSVSWSPGARELGYPVQSHARLTTFFERVQKMVPPDLGILARDGDGAKFLGMLVAAGGKTMQSAWDLLMDYVDEHGVIGRHPVTPVGVTGPNPRTASDRPFSGDMFSGFVLAIARALKEGMVTDEQRLKLTKLWHAVLAEGKPFQFMNALGEKKGLDRGNLWPWFGLLPEIYQVLVFLAAGYAITGEKRYQVLYWIIKILYYPALILGVGDYGIFVGKIIAQAWFTPHSRMATYLAGFELTEDKLFRDPMSYIYVRHGSFNADISAMYMYSYRYSVTLAYEKQRIAYLATLAMSKGTVASCGTVDMTTYFSLRSFRTSMMSDRFLSPLHRGQKYVWENNPLTPVVASAELRRDWSYDVYVPYLFLTQ